MNRVKKIVSCTLLLFFALSCSAQLINPPNINFEASAVGTYTGANSVPGWSLSNMTVNGCANGPWYPGSSEFSIVATPIINFPGAGIIGHSPLGGTKVAQLNNFTPNSYSTKLSTSFSVTTNNYALCFAFAGYYENPGHICCDQPQLLVKVNNCNNLPLSCSAMTLAAGCALVNASYSTGINNAWTNWQIKFIDLSPYIGSCVNIEFINNDCTFGNHIGTTLLDVTCTTGMVPVDGGPPEICGSSPVAYCPNSSTAIISGPMGYPNSTYTWIPPSNSSSVSGSLNQSYLNILNPVANSVYTVLVSSPNASCNFSSTYTLLPGSVSICSLSSKPSCSAGAAGSATVWASGSTSGYNYLWTNASSSVVSTSSVANTLAPGIYTVIVSASGNSLCGLTSGTVAVGTGTSAPNSYLKPYCGASAYFNNLVGTNFQWYYNSTPVAANLGGTAPSHTINSPFQGQIIQVGFNNNGCRDSIIYTLVTVAPGSLSTISNSLCPASTTTTSALITLYPTTYNLLGLNSFSVISSGTTPAYSSSINPTGSNTFNISNLTNNGVYSVTAFDGSCYYSKSFTVSPYSLNFSVSPLSYSTCSGTAFLATCYFSGTLSPFQYSYSWSPTNFLANGMATLQTTIISPSVAPGASATIVYSITVTPSVVNCPQTKTLSVSVFNPLTPSLSAIPNPLCMGSGQNYTINVSPPGGVFSSVGTGSVAPVSGNGVITPSLAFAGLNTYTYTNILGTCSQSASGVYSVNGSLIAISGSSVICIGSSASLNATGINSFTWSTGSNSSSITVAPLTTSSYTVVGSQAPDPCLSITIFTVTVAPLPTVSIGGNSVICSGKTATLMASGANTYSWSNTSTSSSVMVSPFVASTYSVIGTNTLGNCTGSSAQSVSVMPLPTLQITGNSVICQGETTVLNVTGADTFLWSNSVVGSSLIVSPKTTTYYWVTGTDVLTGCSNLGTFSLAVLPCTGLSDNEFNGIKLSVYPNPFNQTLTIENLEPVHLTIYNVIGEVLYSQDVKAGTNLIDAESYSPGIYVLVIEGKNTYEVRKVLKK
ncbi:MAG: T9SS type A sorting domain-containing protein [Bacteroidia bacterium]|nr:T9SS type A sorting domain-containing protein [Bacteroidia bacterium]